MQQIGVNIATSDSATTAIDLSAGADVGDVVVVFVDAGSQATQSISSITDSQGNTYTAREQIIWKSSANRLSIFTAPIGAALTDAHTITITWSSPVYSHRIAIACVLPDVTTFDQSASAKSEYGTAVSASANTTATVTSLVGVVGCQPSKTYGSGNWTTAAAQDGASTRAYIVSYEASSAGAQDPGGTTSANDYWVAAWVAFAPSAAGLSIPVAMHHYRQHC